jgi:hypothetical protein
MPLRIHVISGVGKPEKMASKRAGVPSGTMVLATGRIKLGGEASAMGWLGSGSLSMPTNHNIALLFWTLNKKLKFKFSMPNFNTLLVTFIAKSFTF